MPQYLDRKLDKLTQERLEYWKKQSKLEKDKNRVLNDSCYCVLTVKPEYVVNTHARSYFEDLEAATKYFNTMIAKGVYARIEYPKNQKEPC